MLLHLCVSWQLLSGREEGSADGGESCTEECREHLLHHHHGTSTPADAGTGPYSARMYTLSPPRAGVCTASRAEPPDGGTASSWRLLNSGGSLSATDKFCAIKSA